MAKILRCGSCDLMTMDRAIARRHEHAQFYIEDWAGLVQMRKARETGTYVGVYRSNEAGIESDPDLPWVTVCEKHSTCVCHTSRAQALLAAPKPASWCEECREEQP